MEAAGQEYKAMTRIVIPVGGPPGVSTPPLLASSPPADSSRFPLLLILLLAAAALSGCVSSGVSPGAPALTMMPIAARSTERPASTALAPGSVANAAGRDSGPFRIIAEGHVEDPFRLSSSVPGPDWCTWFEETARAAIDDPWVTWETAMPVSARAFHTTGSAPRPSGVPPALGYRPGDAPRKAPFLDTAVSLGAIAFLVVVLLVPAGCALASGLVQPTRFVVTTLDAETG